MLAPLVPGRGFEPRSPALQAGAVTRSAFRAMRCGRRSSKPGLGVWRKVKESNPQRCRWPGFRDQLPTTERHLPVWPSRGDSNTRPLGPEPSALVRLSYATILAARRGFDPLSSVRQTDCHASSITGLGSCCVSLRFKRTCQPTRREPRRPAFATATAGSLHLKLACRSCAAAKAGCPAR